MEEFTEIKTVKVDYKCPLCKKGYLIATGKVSFESPTSHGHKCLSCNGEQFLPKKYPYMTQKEVSLSWEITIK